MQAYRPFIIAAAATSLSPAVLAQQESALVPKEILVTAQKRETSLLERLIAITPLPALRVAPHYCESVIPIAGTRKPT